MPARGKRIARWMAAATALAAPIALAQTIPQAPDSPNDYPAALPARKGPAPPAMLFKLLAEVPLPSAPSGRELVLEEGKLLVPVDGKTAAVELTDPVSLTLQDPAAQPPSSATQWVVSEDGRFRVRTDLSGRVEAQKRGRFFHKWRSAWRLRVPGATRAPALILGKRVVFGSLDNQVYCVRRKNGHRVWAADLDDRISSPLAAWRGQITPPAAPGRPPAPTTVEAILVVPDGGSSLYALDIYDGSRLATFEVTSGNGMLATAPLVLPDGRVAVARTSYASGGAALLVLRPALSEEPRKTGPK